jgi:uncharacterized protein
VNRAYSLLEIKSADDVARVIEGIATTPSPDRVGDVVEPLGAKFKNPLPLLWMHYSDKPVGTATFGKPTEKGIPFTAKIASLDEPGALKDRLDEAWQSVKAKLVRGVSIGFRALEYAYMEGGGVRYVESEILELSLVTIPANADATIQTIKSIDMQHRAASGRNGGHLVVRLPSPGVTGKSTAGVFRLDSLTHKANQ